MYFSCGLICLTNTSSLSVLLLVSTFSTLCFAVLFKILCTTRKHKDIQPRHKQQSEVDFLLLKMDMHSVSRQKQTGSRRHLLGQFVLDFWSRNKTLLTPRKRDGTLPCPVLWELGWRECSACGGWFLFDGTLTVVGVMLKPLGRPVGGNAD